MQFHQLSISFLILLIVLSCSNNRTDLDPVKSNASLENRVDQANLQKPEPTGVDESNSRELSQTIKGISYRIKYMPAIEFLEKKGEMIDPSDLESLKKEQVLLLEIQSDKPYEEILDDQRMSMPKDEAINFLGSSINSDLVVTQNKQEIRANGCSYEGMVGDKSKIRCVFFFSNIHLEKDFDIRFYDRLFQAGLMRFKS